MNSNDYTQNLSLPPFSEQQKRNLLVLVVSIFPLVVTSLVFVLVVLIGNISFPEKVGSKSEFGEIILPANKSVVDGQVTISGTIEDLADEQFIYLVEHRENLYWPKYAIGNKAITWSKELTNRGKQGEFVAYQLVMVGTEGKKILDDWYKTSRETGKYPGMAEIKFSQAVAKIRVKTK